MLTEQPPQHPFFLTCRHKALLYRAERGLGHKVRILSKELFFILIECILIESEWDAFPSREKAGFCPQTSALLDFIFCGISQSDQARAGFRLRRAERAGAGQAARGLPKARRSQAGGTEPTDRFEPSHAPDRAP